MAVSGVLADVLPTNYEYYTSGGIKSGLSADQPYFTLNDRNISIYSGAMHYFRVPRAYWRDRLRKMRAAGLNTVETYVPWNLHEHQSGRFDFGHGGSDMEDFLYITEFLKTAQEEDLFVIVRSGPFICGEFEYGGHPSWLLREDGIQPRTSDPKYMKYVTRYFNVLMPILTLLQFTKGGPIIAFQVENEFALMGQDADKNYLRLLRDILLDKGIVELLVTSDNPDKGTMGTIPELFLMTGNFDKDPVYQLDLLKELQPGRPIMTMEYWSGWFDYWGKDHITKSTETFREVYEAILSYPSSVNMYMFEAYESVTSSYEYDAPLSEGGDYTEKYLVTRQLLDKYNPVKTKLPDPPDLIPKTAYPNIKIEEQLPIRDALGLIQPVFSQKLIAMEKLDINNNSGQSYGYVVYRKENLRLDAGSVLLIEGRNIMMTWIRNMATPNSTIVLSTKDLVDATLDLIVENWGRVNVYPFIQFKGLYQGVAKINNVEVKDWMIFPLEFKKSWTNSLVGWKSDNLDTIGPSLYKTVLKIESEPRDTFVYMENWTKGIVIVNGFVLGRYNVIGPIQTLYLPAPLLNEGSNDIAIFEHYRAGEEIVFSTRHIYARH
ncbi:hypothetical protein NQ314_017131 [Rhamnusium bicolor]|uniref:Beta-galactosidase n=1 Tax=Rhamnusium bicolor TaxID=1586634 RepID=A0AAV8WUA5_9CUCU|nr:hypothetical protein NQ314_017131 [Rhamnusium bicolor]